MSVMKDSLVVFKEGARVNFSVYGHLVPVFAAVLDDEPQLMAVVWDSPTEKDIFARHITQMIAQGRLTEYIMVAEAWTARIKEGEQEKVRDFLREHGSLESWPDRGEVVQVRYCSAKEEIEFTASINRGIIGADLGQWVETTRHVNFDLNDFSARFQGLFLKAKAGLN